MRISDWSSDVCSSDLLTGPGGPNLYFKGLIEKLAINVEVFRVGAFKSAVEPFTRSDQSPEAEAAAQALVNTIWSVWKGDVARARPRAKKIGEASWRERVCQYVSISVVAASLKKKQKK